jgi:putative transposase
MERFSASMRKACVVIKLNRVAYLYKSNARDNSALVMQMKEITQIRVDYGYRRVHDMLRRVGFRDNLKHVYGMYREQGWSLRLKRPKRNKVAQLRQPKKLASHINQIWSMDFAADNLLDESKLRKLTAVDCFTLESLGIHVDQSLNCEDIVRVLNKIVATRGKPT